MKIVLTNNNGLQISDELDIGHIISTSNLTFFSNGNDPKFDIVNFELDVCDLVNTRLFKSKIPMLVAKTSEYVNISTSREQNEDEQLHVVFTTMADVKISFYTDDIYIEKDCINFSFYDEKEFESVFEKLGVLDVAYDGEVSGVYYISIFFEEYHKFHIHLNSESEYTGKDDDVNIYDKKDSLNNSSSLSKKAKKAIGNNHYLFDQQNESINNFKNRLN